MFFAVLSKIHSVIDEFLWWSANCRKERHKSLANDNILEWNLTNTCWPFFSFFFFFNPNTAAPHLAKSFSPLGNVGCVLIEPGSWKPDLLVTGGRRDDSASLSSYTQIWLTFQVHYFFYLFVFGNGFWWMKTFKEMPCYDIYLTYIYFFSFFLF